MKLARAALVAVAMTCLPVPASPALAQAGISTNPPPVEIRDYVSAVHALSRYEVDASRLALTQSRAQASRSFAQQMVEHHTRIIAEHARLLNIPAATDSGSALVGPLSEMLNSLENTPAAEFHAAYRQGQIAAHEEALKVHSAYASRGSDAGVQAKAQAALPVIRKHLEAARKLPGA
ncbi:DUF4142 domain-containing protein [Sphingomonas lenta]|uniref:DUF4142 domain-containing protein n=1 Tax=Sphingomonas lenta TaxID=1141887 RepID=A0A2A2SB60_9SPHN|nr:DUF4142 domain-containing protein [Sphingomonas lenta]PAX06486.1 hypothetical protein CKY28_17190 [Sphingomonas lenta]